VHVTAAKGSTPVNMTTEDTLPDVTTNAVENAGDNMVTITVSNTVEIMKNPTDYPTPTPVDLSQMPPYNPRRVIVEYEPEIPINTRSKIASDLNKKI
jgi:hypothetical protein